MVEGHLHPVDRVAVDLDQVHAVLLGVLQGDVAEVEPIGALEADPDILALTGQRSVRARAVSSVDSDVLGPHAGTSIWRLHRMHTLVAGCRDGRCRGNDRLRRVQRLAPDDRDQVLSLGHVAWYRYDTAPVP